MKTLELHYPMIQFLIKVIITHRLIFARFYWLLYVMWCKSLDSYYTMSPPASIFVLRLLPSKRSKASVKSVSTWHFYYFMYREKTQTRFVESGYIDIDNKMLVANAVPESAKKKSTKKSTKYERTTVS